MATTTPDVPAAIVRRAATIARGPHACPTCEAPTWAEPPVPWTELRDYVVRCDSCERPITVHVDRDRILRRGAVPVHLRAAAGHDAVSELLDTRGRRAFALRLAAAALPSVAIAVLAQLAGASVEVTFLLAVALVVPGAAWGPAIAAATAAWVAGAARSVARRVRSRVAPHRAPSSGATIELVPGRWDQWQREQRLRDRDRAEHPDAVLAELERVLDDRELRRVRLLAERGEVPSSNLADLLEYRRTWAACADEELPTFLRDTGA